MPIHFKRVDLLFHHGSACNASYVLVASVNIMALVLPIKRGLFFAGNVIGLGLPTNLLVMDGLKQGGERGFLSLFMGFNLLSFCCFLFFWKHTLGDSFLD